MLDTQSYICNSKKKTRQNETLLQENSHFFLTIYTNVSLYSDDDDDDNDVILPDSASDLLRNSVSLFSDVSEK